MPQKSSEVFASISKLLAMPVSRLTSRQRVVVDAHLKAKKALYNFKEARTRASIRTPIASGSLPQTTLRRTNPYPSHLELNATGKALDALRESLRYYHQHGEVDRAYSDLRAASHHWHPSVRQSWDHYFASQLSDLGIKASSALQRKIARGRAKLIAPLVSSGGEAINMQLTPQPHIGK